MKHSILGKAGKIFTGYIPGKAQTEEYQREIIALVVSIAAPAAAIFSVVNYLHGHVWLAAVELFAIAPLILCFIVSRRNDSLLLAKNLLMLDATLVFASLFVDGGIANDGMIWTLIFPFFASLLMGLPVAWYWIIAFSVIVLGWSAAHFTRVYTLAYSDQALIYYPGSFIFFALIAAAFETQLERMHSNREKTIAELEELRDSLEENVKQRTAALLKSNEELKHEMKQHQKTAQALQESEERFYQAQKMEAVGTLVGGIAHDFNNMLSGISGNAFMIGQKTGDQPEILERIATIDSLVGTAADMIRQLLTFARRDNVEYKPFDLLLFIKEAYKLAGVSIPSKVRLTLDFSKGDYPVRANATQLQQVLMNLINNARDAVKDSEEPRIKVTLSRIDPDTGLRERHPELKAASYARLTVSDNGSGIDADLIDKVFDPFFTTKEAGKGTGLGLAMCYGAMQGHGGTISVDSTPGEGTSFHLYLPIYNEEESALQQTSIHSAVRGNGEYILICESDPDLGYTQKETLGTLGYRAIQAISGNEVVEIFRQHGEKIDLLLLGLGLPGMSGVEVARRVRELKKDARIIFMSAYREESTYGEGGLPSAGETILDKPFTVDELSHAVHDKLMATSAE